MGKLGGYGVKATPVLLTDKTAATDGVTTFNLSLQEIKDIAGGISLHNSFPDLNTGNYLHLTAAEKANFTAIKVTTIGTGGDYALLSTALAAGKNRLMLISNITETSNIIFSTYTEINLNSYELNIVGNYKFIFTVKIKIYNGSITFAHSTPISGLFQEFDLSIDNVIITNNSTANGCYILNTGSINNCTMNLPNYSSCGIGSAINDNQANVLNTTINGGGSSCQFAISGIQNQNNPEYKNITLTGSFDAIALYCHSIKALNYKGSTNTVVLFARTAYDVLDLTGANRLTTRFQNLFFGAILAGGTISYGSADGKLIGCYFTTALTVSASNVSFENCTFVGGLIISGDNISIVNCKVGAVNGGTKTITVQATADKTILIGNRTEAAISDSGSNTSSNNNLLF